MLITGSPANETLTNSLAVDIDLGVDAIDQDVVFIRAEILVFEAFDAAFDYSGAVRGDIVDFVDLGRIFAAVLVVLVFEIFAVFPRFTSRPSKASASREKPTCLPGRRAPWRSCS